MKRYPTKHPNLTIINKPVSQEQTLILQDPRMCSFQLEQNRVNMYNFERKTPNDMCDPFRLTVPLQVLQIYAGLSCMHLIPRSRYLCLDKTRFMHLLHDRCSVQRSCQSDSSSSITKVVL